MMSGAEKDTFNSVPRLQATCLLNSHQDLCFSEGFSPVIRARLERFDFPLRASEPGCELSKDASEAAAEKLGGERGSGRHGGFGV